MSIDERIEVERIQILPPGLGQSGNVARRYRARDPVRKCLALIRRAEGDLRKHVEFQSAVTVLHDAAHFRRARKWALHTPDYYAVPMP